MMEFLTRTEVAEYFRVNPRTVDRWIKGRKLKGHKLGKQKASPMRIPRNELKRFLVKNSIKK